MQNFYNEFISWLEGLIEDDPIPFEIKSLVFFINKNFEIGFSGTEKQSVKIIDFGFYLPLEAEFFYCPNFYKNFCKKQKQEKLNEIKNLLIKLKNQQNFSKFNIFYGFLFEKAYRI